MNERRSLPRYRVRVPCSILCALTGATILTHTEGLSENAISLTIPTNPTYGADPGNVGVDVELKLALPVGYVRLSGSLVRLEQANTVDNLFVFKIEEANEVDRRMYNEHLESLGRKQAP